jgi:branched-chain amino acid transport system ATP-binding protein
MGNAILRLESVSKHFGGLKALSDVNMEITRGEIISLIGPNGAGKTTLLNAITRQYPLSGGKVYFEDERIDQLKPHKIAGIGIGRTFQIVNLPQKLTVLENVAIGAHCRGKAGLMPTIFRTASMKAEEGRILDNAMEVIKLFDLEAYANDVTGHLPLGSQRVVEMARAMMCEPKIIFLDEVTTGLNLKERGRVIDVIKKIHDQGTTVFMISHDMAFAMGLSHKIFVLYFGKNLAEGTPDEIKENQEVINVYLGKTDSNS